ncbi:hypothetical protein KY290_029940 [Solanum tuberosum]|uniref:Uncharacterized protein n=1 Tax=Solanum tuberosum TaxID=4113 RepID=A0ABQ7UM68_SOLTU|nr:hypothetical protein KY290_029940 [Solanum tuberosum]
MLNNLCCEYVNINSNDYDINCDEKTGILVHKMIKEVPSISLLKLCKASLKMHDPEESIVCLDSHLKIVWAGYALKSEEASKKVLNVPRTSSQVLLTFHDAKLKRWSDNWLDSC